MCSDWINHPLCTQEEKCCSCLATQIASLNPLCWELDQSYLSSTFQGILYLYASCWRSNPCSNCKLYNWTPAWVTGGCDRRPASLDVVLPGSHEADWQLEHRLDVVQTKDWLCMCSKFCGKSPTVELSTSTFPEKVNPGIPRWHNNRRTNPALSLFHSQGDSTRLSLTNDQAQPGTQMWGPFQAGGKAALLSWEMGMAQTHFSKHSLLRLGLRQGQEEGHRSVCWCQPLEKGLWSPGLRTQHLWGARQFTKHFICLLCNKGHRASVEGWQSTVTYCCLLK